MKSNQMKSLPYPDNLIISLFGESEATNDLLPLSDDQVTGLRYALTFLEENEQKMLIMRFENCLTYKEIGAVFGNSPNQARLIITKALRFLRHPCRSGYIQNGFEGMTKRLEDLKCKEYEAASSNDTLIKSEEINEPLTLDSPLEALPLSVRPYNGLYRAGIKTIRQFLLLSGDEIIPSLGKISWEEIKMLQKAAREKVDVNPVTDADKEQ